MRKQDALSRHAPICIFFHRLFFNPFRKPNASLALAYAVRRDGYNPHSIRFVRAQAEHVDLAIQGPLKRSTSS